MSESLEAILTSTSDCTPVGNPIESIRALKSKTVNVLDELINDEENTVTIEEGTNKNPHEFLHIKDNKNNARILFRGDIGTWFVKDLSKKHEIENMGYNSPAGNLAHEIMHSYSKFYDKNFQDRWNDTESTKNKIYYEDEDMSFKNKEEEYNTTMTNQVLTKLKEDNRIHYSVGKYFTISPISTKSK